MSDISIAGPAATGAPFRVGVVLSKTFSVFGSRLGSFLLLALVPLLPVLAVILLPLAGPQKAPAVASAPGLGGLGGVLYFVLGIVAQATTLYGAFQQMGGKPFSIAESLGVGLRRALPVLGVALLTGLFTGLAFILLVVPGIIVLCVLYVAVPICVIEKLGVTASIDRSAKLTKGYRWQIFGLVALVGIISFIVQITLFLLGPGQLWDQILTFGWLVIATSFGAVLVAVVYHDLRVAKEGMDIDNIANVFD
jgi:hypothetical protein